MTVEAPLSLLLLVNSLPPAGLDKESGGVDPLASASGPARYSPIPGRADACC